MALVEGACPQVMFVGGGRRLDQFQHGFGLPRREVSRRELVAHMSVIWTSRIRCAKIGERILGLSMLEKFLA